MRKQLVQICKDLSPQFGVEVAAALAFLEVETGGRGFDIDTGKLIIQFEPAWFRKKAPYAPSGRWSVNKVERQAAEWLAFNDAYAKDSIATMQSTSIGIGQVMGYHYKRLGYSTVNDMWDDAKRNEERQIWQMFRFIQTDPVLLKALKQKRWKTVAGLYNGWNYRDLAVKYHRVPYDDALAAAYERFNALKL